jgi:hypothetical protein
MDKVTVKLKYQAIFRQLSTKMHTCFGIKIYELCNIKGYTCDMKVYLRKDSQTVTDKMTATYTTVGQVTRKVDRVGHRLRVVNFFTPPALIDDLAARKIN